MRVIAAAVLAAGAVRVAAPAAVAQQVAPKDPEPLAVGAVAPYFTLPGATCRGAPTAAALDTIVPGVVSGGGP